MRRRTFAAVVGGGLIALGLSLKGFAQSRRRPDLPPPPDPGNVKVWVDDTEIVAADDTNGDGICAQLTRVSSGSLVVVDAVDPSGRRRIEGFVFAERGAEGSVGWTF